MSTINSGENNTLEDKHININTNTKESGYNELPERNMIIDNHDKNNKSIADNNNKNNSQVYYKLFLYSDSGTCIYHKNYNNSNESIEEESENEGVDKEIGAIQGIIQAVYFTSFEIDYEIHMISTDIGLLSYKAFTHEKNVLLLALIFPNFYSDETLSHRISKLLLEYIYSFLLMNIGKKTLFKFSNSNEIEKLRRIIDIYSSGINYILNNHSSLTFILKAEQKLQVDKETIYNIKYYIGGTFQKSIKKDILCLTVNDNIVWATSDWLNIHITDRILFVLLSKIFSSGDLMEIPIYFTKTKLEDEGLGISPYKLFIVNLKKNIKLLIVSDNFLELENLDFSFADDFFISKLTQMERIDKFGNDILDTYLKGAVIHNKFLKTYKILGDQDLKEVYENFLINNTFTNFLFDNEGECLSDQFYVKDNTNFTFYFYKINALCFLLLFDKDISFEDINAVTSTLKTLKDSFDNKENYKDFEDK